jgi:hypothetical protein
MSSTVGWANHVSSARHKGTGGFASLGTLVIVLTIIGFVFAPKPSRKGKGAEK